MQQATPEMIEEWKNIFEEVKEKLSPNRKTGSEVLSYLKERYPLSEITNEKWNQLILGNVLSNECYYEKLPDGAKPLAIAFLALRSGAGKILYEKQDEIFKGQDIYVGIELVTGFFMVEGSSELWNELFAFRGLDEEDLKNYYLVAEYISCLKQFK